MARKKEQNEVTIKQESKGGLRIPWSVIAFILMILFVIGAIYGYTAYGNKQKEFNSLKTSYDEANKKIGEKEEEINKFNEQVNQLSADLATEKGINVNVNCRKLNPKLNLEGISFTYSGNAYMNGQLKKFVQQMDEKIVSSAWNLIWNNVDVGMHKITVSDNIRFYFIVSYKDKNFPRLVNSIYWIDRGCFLDFPGF